MTARETTNTNTQTARIVGVLYILGTVAGVLSVVFAGSILDDPENLINVSVSQNQVIIGALCALSMALALAMIPVVIFPILKKFNEVLALGYVVFRGALETVTYFATVICSLLLLTLSQVYAQAGAPDTFSSLALGTLLKAEMISSVTTIVFILGALMFYWVLYQSELVPRWLSGWGLIAAIPYLAAGLLVMFGPIGHMSTIDTVLRLPLGAQEMVLAGWLIAKGFNPSVLASKSAQVDMNQA